MGSSQNFSNEYLAGLFDAEGSSLIYIEKGEKTRARPMLQMEMSHAFFSGFFDGEGHVGIHFQSNLSFSPELQASTCDEAIILLLKEKFGGQVYTHLEKKGNRLRTWKWKLGGLKELPQIRKVASILYQHCIIKKRQLGIFLYEVLPIFESHKPWGYWTKEELLKLAYLQNKMNPRANARRKNWLTIIQEEYK